MKSKTKLKLGAAAAVCGLAGLALATPSAGLIFTNVFGAIDRDVENHVKVALPPGSNEDDAWNVEFETEGASNFIFQDVTFAPGGTSGWHSHPGILLVSVASGSIKWYDSKCVPKTYNAGDSLTENDKLHVVHNEGVLPARLMITFVVPKGVNRRIDQPAPACAVAAGIS